MHWLSVNSEYYIIIYVSLRFYVNVLGGYMKLIFLAFLASLLVGDLAAKENLFEALPLTVGKLSEKARLGKLLFHDPVLSKDNSISCANCHPLLNYGVDNLSKSIGINKAKGKRNAPTVWNSRYNFVQFWDGRARTLKEQAVFSITNELEMNETLESVVLKLRQNKSYNSQFNALYDDGVTADNLADAIATFVKTLITPGSKFDQYLRGDEKILSVEEKEGLVLFKEKGCIACHNGINVGGTLYQRIGMFKKFDSKEEDLGRYELTKKLFDKYTFKVPGLRNVNMTAPYFHDGSVATLKEAVEMMVELQLGRELDEKDINKIVMFLKTLTGKVHD